MHDGRIDEFLLNELSHSQAELKKYFVKNRIFLSKKLKKRKKSERMALGKQN